MKTNKNRKGFLPFRKYLKSSYFRWMISILLSVFVGLLFFGYFSGFFGAFVNNFRAAVGYGCGSYNISTTYGNDCPDPLQQSDLINLNTLVSGINCSPDPINATTTTTCTGTLPVNYTPPVGVLNMKVSGQGGVVCTFLGNTFTCSNMVGAVITGPAVNIQASIDSNPFLNTGKTIQVDMINFTQADVPFLNTIVGGINCNPDPAEVTPMNTDCSGVLPAYYNPFGGVFELRIDSNIPSTCTFAGSSFTCSDIVTGSNVGTKNIQGSVNSGGFVSTGANILVNLIELSVPDLANLNTLVSGINCSPDPVAALQTTTCTGTLPVNYQQPSQTLKLKIQNQSEVNCSFVGNIFTCPVMNSGTIIGVRNVQAAIDSSIFVNTGASVSVTPVVFNQSHMSNLNTILGDLDCIPSSINVLVIISCGGVLPNYFIPPSGVMQLRVSGQNTVNCTFVGNTFNCPGMMVGSVPSIFNIQGSLAPSPFVNTGKLVTVKAIPLTQSLIGSLDSLVGGFNCSPDPVAVNNVISCSGTLPSTHTAPSGVLNLGVQGQSTVPCSFIGQVFSCNNMTVGSLTGLKSIQAKIGSGALVNTGADVQVNPIILTQNDLASLEQIVGGLNCSPQLAVINSVISCSGTLPTQYSSPTNNLSLNVQGAGVVACIFTGNSFNCPNMPTGDVFGVRAIQASVGSGGIVVDTGKVLIVQSSVAGDRFIEDKDIINIGTGNRKDPFDSIACGEEEDDLVAGGVETVCRGSLVVGLLLPIEFQLGIGTTPGGKCVQENTDFVCTGVPVINKAGIAILKVRVSGGDILGTNHIVTVEGVNPNAGVDSGTNTNNNIPGNVVQNLTSLSRTGAGLTIIMLTIGAVGLLFIIYTPQFRKKIKIKLK